ncbi:MOP flippase family protein [candidate division KSB1 bacterium]|nr:MOP flippase family protein [candidate division KSB1 bacterium]
MSLAQKIIKGVLWTGLSKMSMQGVLFIVTAILARLLSKNDFGVVGMAALITVAISLVNDRGLGTAVVQKKDLSEGHLSSLFWGGIAFGLMLFFTSVVASHPLRYFFANKLLQPVVIVLAFDFIVGSLGIVQKSLLTRQMDFKTLSIIETSAVVISGTVSIAIALLGGGVWSLVAQSLVRDVINVVLIWIYCPWRPRYHFSWPEFKELFGFSARVLGNDMAFYLVVNADITIVGKFLGAAVLGSYSLALNVVKLPVIRLSGVVSKVTFPAFSSVQDDLTRFKRGYAKSMAYISLITFPLLAVMALYAEEFILLFFGAKWSDMVLPLILLVPMAMLKSVGTIRGSVFMACGKPQIELWWNLGYLLPLAGCIYLGTYWGLVGAASAYTSLYVVTFPIIQSITNRQVGMSGREFMRALWPAASACAFMVAIASLARFALKWVGISGMVTIFSSGLLLCIVSYLVFLLGLHKQHLVELVTLFKIARDAKRAGSFGQMEEGELS